MKIVRTENAGVFAGTLQSIDDLTRKAVMTDARRLWYWDGAASLSQLAMEGTKAPENCKFPVPVARVELFQVIEITDMTEVAEKSIREVPIWAK